MSGFGYMLSCWIMVWIRIRILVGKKIMGHDNRTGRTKTIKKAHSRIYGDTKTHLSCSDPECNILATATPYKHDEAPPEYVDSFGRIIGKEGGFKNDKDKPNWWLLPLETIEGIVEVLTYGAKKYKPNNWKKISIERNFAALLRHLSKWQAGEEFDPESGLHHLDHALCDLMFIAWKIKAR